MLNRISAGVAASVLALGLAGAAPAMAQDYTFTFAHVLMEDTPNGQAALKFAETVAEKSDGRIQINVLPAGQLGGDVEIIEQVQQGIVQIAIPPTATLGNFEPKLQLLDLPYILPSYDKMVEVLDGPLGRQILDTLEPQGFYGVNFWGAGFRHMTNNVRPITSVEDLADIKMRTMQAPVILTQYREWDANPTAMAFAEVYSGLQAGVVEGQENPIANISAMRFYEVQDYMTLTGHAYHGYAAIVHKDTWDALPQDLKAVMVEAFNEGRDYARKLTAEFEAEQLEVIAESTQVHELTAEQKQGFVEASFAVHEAFADTVGADLLESIYAVTGVKDE